MSKRYLIVDDDAGARELMRSLVSGPDVECWEAGDGEKAVEMHRSLRPDLVIMDIQMHPLDGLMAARQILKGDPSARIILVSQYDSRQVRNAAAATGATDYLDKEHLCDLESIIARLPKPPTA